MIRVNLALRKGPAASSGESGQGRLKIAGLGNLVAGLDYDQIKALPIKRAIIFFATGIFIDQFSANYKEQQMTALTDAIAKIEAKKTSLQAELDKTKGFEDIKKQLDADELTMRTKIEVIKKLLEDRAAPPKMMEALANAMPTDVWLKSLKIEGVDVAFKGSSLSGVNPISDFMKALNESAYFVDPKVTTKKESDEGGGDVDGFELTAKRR